MRSIILAIGLAFAAYASAVPVTVRGSPSCGEWVQTRASSESWPALVTQRWLTGYLSGLAIATNVDILKGRDNASLFLWTDKYCQSNPLNYLVDAGDQLYKELSK